jgi:hypothetical protein
MSMTRSPRTRACRMRTRWRAFCAAPRQRSSARSSGRFSGMTILEVSFLFSYILKEYYKNFHVYLTSFVVIIIV